MSEAGLVNFISSFEEAGFCFDDLRQIIKSSKLKIEYHLGKPFVSKNCKKDSIPSRPSRSQDLYLQIQTASTMETTHTDPNSD